ncbi:MAG: DinB family protein [bacterium]|nr:DinB family protein [bacterium]
MESSLRLYAWNLLYANALVSDLSESQCRTPAGPGLENHPSWTIGHLVSGSDILAEDLGMERNIPKGWQDLFERRGPGDPRLPNPNAEIYPQMNELKAELERQHQRVETAWRAKLLNEDCKNTELATPLAWRYSSALPTLGDATLFLAISHEAMHLGQLAAWRRALDLPSALNML